MSAEGYEVKISAFRDAAQDVTEVSATANAEVAPNVMESIVDFFNPSATVGADPQTQTQQNDTALNVQQSVWKPQPEPAPNKVMQGTQAASNAADARGAEAETGLQNIAAFEKDMNGQQAGAQTHDDSANGMNLAGAGRGLAFDFGVGALVGAAFNPAAGAALSGAMVARDVIKTFGNDPRISETPSPKVIRGTKAEIEDERARLASQNSPSNNSFEKAAYGYGRSANPIATAMNGGGSDLMGRLRDTMSFDIAGAQVGDSPEAATMNGHIQEMKAGFEHQLHTANELKDGFAARANKGVEIQTAGELKGVNAENAQMSASQKTAFVPGHIA